MEAAVLKLISQSNAPSSVKEESDINGSDASMINGMNITRLPTRDAYSYGLQLIDLLFTKEELGSSLA